MKQFAVSPGREEVSSLLLALPDLSQQGGQRRIQWNGEMTGGEAYGLLTEELCGLNSFL